MIYLLLSILLHTTIFVSFRSFTSMKINTFQAVVINYLVCTITGLVFLPYPDELRADIVARPWVIWAAILGVLFIGTFYLMARTTQRLGVTVASVASKTSLIIPVLFSMLVFQIQSRSLDLLNILGIILGIFAIFFSSLKSGGQVKGISDLASESLERRDILMPIGVFLFSGTIDTLLNYTSFKYLKPTEEALFPIIIFAIAGIIGFTILIIKKEKIKLINVIGGIYLGIPNYFSIYFLIKALGAFKNDGAILFPLNNIGIILVSGLVGVMLFRERLNNANKLGIILSIFAILLISYQEILGLNSP